MNLHFQELFDHENTTATGIDGNDKRAGGRGEFENNKEELGLQMSDDYDNSINTNVVDHDNTGNIGENNIIDDEKDIIVGIGLMLKTVLILTM